MRPLLVYAAAAILTTWPLAIHPVALLGAPIGPGDPYLNLWILGWGLQAWTSNPVAVITGRVFDANIFFPAAGTLAYSDHLLLQSGVLAPVYALTGSVVLCYNLLVIGSLIASALAMHLFVSRVVGSKGGAYIAGLAWGFGSFRFAHLLHLQLQALYFLPLTFLFLHRVIAGRRKRDAVALGVLMALQALASIYYAVIGGVGLLVAAVALAVTSSRRGLTRVGVRLVLAAVVAGVLVLPVGIAYWRVQQTQGFGRNLFEASRNAAFVDSYFQVPPGNVLYGRTGVLRGADASGPVPHTGPERELFPGFAILLMAIAGAVLGWRTDVRPLVAAMTALVVTGFVLSLGPDGARGLYAFLHNNVFGFQAIRASARFAVLALFGVTTLAAVAWREWSHQAHRPGGALPAIGAMVLAMVALECLHLPTAFAPAPPARTEVGQWLRDAPGNGAVAVFPVGLDVENTAAMVQSLEHRRPIVNGYSGQRPAFYASLVDTLSSFPSPDALTALHESGVQYIVTPAAIERPANEPAWPLVPRARFQTAAIYELVWSAEAEARFNTSGDVVPPPVGPLPFTTGERARYVVRWDGAGVDVPAGEITLTVDPPPYQFVATAETAPWVTRFFEARDRFVTTTDASLLPRTHTRDLHEGSRQVTRVYEYDRSKGTVTAGEVTLPLQPEARDAIASLYYVRSLPLDPGARFQFPVNEAGRSLIVDMQVGPRESVVVAGERIAVIRLEPRLRQRVERRAPVTATVWISDDARRIPVLVEVAAGFGQVRMELIEYQAGK